MDEKQEKTMYSVSLTSVARKNFVAGFTHALGGFVVTLISWGVIYLILVKLILPQLGDTITQLQDTLKLIPKGSIQVPAKGTTKGALLPEDLLQQLQQAQK